MRTTWKYVTILALLLICVGVASAEAIGSGERWGAGASRAIGAGVGRRSAGTTTPQTSTPAASSANSGVRENSPGVPRYRTRGGRSFKPIVVIPNPRS